MRRVLYNFTISYRILVVNVRPSVQEHLHHGVVPTQRGISKGRAPILHKMARNLTLPIHGFFTDACSSYLILLVDIRPTFQQQLHHGDTSFAARNMKGRALILHQI